MNIKQLIASALIMAVSAAATAQSLSEKDKTGTENGHEWVDLGLPSGTKWATRNMGSRAAEYDGCHYAWGETVAKASYSWLDYRFAEYSLLNGNYVYNSRRMTKYCTDNNCGHRGFTDNKTSLEPEDDAATVSWGGKWRMPTKEEFDELLNEEYCTWTWTSQKRLKEGVAAAPGASVPTSEMRNWEDVSGYRVTSKVNGVSIFLPAAGARQLSNVLYAGVGGYYWTASLKNPYVAFCLILDKDGFLVVDNEKYENRCHGYTVRPVCK